MAKPHDYIELLAQHPKFVLFTKKRRLQLIYEPDKKQIRDRGKARWKIALVSDDLAEVQTKLNELANNMEQKDD